MTDSYSYESRKGIRPISWQDFYALCKGLAVAAAPYNPEIILGIARGGLYPATQLSHLMRKELYPIRLTRRIDDEVRHVRPVWLTRPPVAVNGQNVLIVDEVCDSGETLLMVKDEVQKIGARSVRTAVLYSHTRAQNVPDYIGLITDQLVLNPWDREMLQDGQFVFHPEYVSALRQQGIDATPDLLPGIDAAKIDKTFE